MKVKSHLSGKVFRCHHDALSNNRVLIARKQSKIMNVGARFIAPEATGAINGAPTDMRLPRRGSILIACLIILATLTVYGGVLVSAVYERSLNVGVEVDRLQALYLAEAALAKSLNEVKSLRDPDGDGLGTVPATEFGSGTYYAIHDPGTLAITGVGEVHGVKRRVRIKYEGL